MVNGYQKEMVTKVVPHPVVLHPVAMVVLDQLHPLDTEETAHPAVDMVAHLVPHPAATAPQLLLLNPLQLAALATKAPQAQPVQKVQPVKTVLMETTVKTERTARTPPSSLPSQPKFASSAHQAHLVHKVNLVQRVHLAQRDLQESHQRTVSPATKVCKVNPVQLDAQAAKVHVVPQDSQVVSSQSQAHKVQPVHQAQPENKVQRVNQVQTVNPSKAHQVCPERLAKPVAKVAQAHQVQPVHLETMERRVLANTAHHHVPHQDIKPIIHERHLLPYIVKPFAAPNINFNNIMQALSINVIPLLLLSRDRKSVV